MAPKILTPEQMEEIVRKGVRAELDRIGLRVESEDHADEAAKDFLFVRNWRKTAEGISAKVGMAVIMIIVGGTTAALWEGFKLLSRK